MDLPVPYRPGIPIPPGELIFRVSGSPEPKGFHYGGKWTLDMFENALARVGRTFGDFTDIYDFGCGCGRLTPWLLEAAAQARLYGSDIDDVAVDWLRRNFPEGDFRTNQGLPSLPFRNVTFDLVIGYSVFTHLDEEYQDAWLAELHRVTRPGAILLLTVNLDRAWAYSATRSPAVYEEHMRRLRARITAEGILYDRADDWGEHFPDFYHTTWHTSAYIREHWSRW
ncbi:MAG TPA: class I SAM-dependent methyltransferase, partial [Gemmatimonadaceae bacterium]